MTPLLLQAWKKTLAAAPRAPALIEAASGRIWTRRELDRASDAWLARHPFDFNGRIVLFSEPNGPQWLVLLLALIKARAVVAPLDPGEPPARQLAIARSLRASYRWTGHVLETFPRGRAFSDRRRIVKLTSGSTGTPRALAFTDAQMLADGRHVCAGMRVSSSDFNYALIPFGHSYGWGNLVIPLLAQGTAIICGSTALPHVIATEISRFRPTVFPAVPALLRALVEADISPASLASLRTVISAGAPLDPAIARAFHTRFKRLIHNFYGSSETGGIAYDRTGTASLEGRGVGTPLPGVTVSLARGRRVRVHSLAVYTLGNRHPATHVAADFGEINERGELVLRGRTGRTIKVAGRRLNLSEIEHALRSLPGVRDAYALPHPERQESVAAVVACDTQPPAWRDALRSRLASWKVPRSLIALPSFPLTPRGKTDTRQLRALVGARA